MNQLRGVGEEVRCEECKIRRQTRRVTAARHGCRRVMPSMVASEQGWMAWLMETRRKGKKRKKKVHIFGPIFLYFIFTVF